MNRRFRPVIGPGLVIALALAGLFVWRRMQPPEIARPVVIQHESAIAATGVPDPPFVLGHAASLALSLEQTGKVRKLADEYTIQTADLRQALDEAGRQAEAKLTRAAGEPPTPTDVQEASRGVAELSGLLAEKRAEAWTRLQPVLTAQQQEQARQAWAEAHTLRLPSE